MKWLVTLVFLVLQLSAEEFKINSIMIEKNVTSQFDNTIDISQQHHWIVSWDKETTRLANDYFTHYHDSLFKTIVLVDVSQTPQGIMSLFVLPRMRTYHHQNYLSYDENFNKMIPYMPNHVTLIEFKHKKIISIHFFDTIKKLNNYFKGKCHE